MSSCAHSSLLLEPSAHATAAGYRSPTARQLAAALKGSQEVVYGAGTFPAPLVLPNDELAFDPACPGQDMGEWLRGRKPIAASDDKTVIYVAGPPAVRDEASFVSHWAVAGCSDSTPCPAMSDVAAYLAAFYHGVPVRPLPVALSFGLWSKRGRAHIALCTEEDATRIRTRRDPTGTFPRQLCLDDLLDGVIAVLPADACALLLLVTQDLFEDADDDFVCGRAYGGSRVAVVSMARYRPALDARQGVERVHAWPASHCRAYVAEACEEARPAKRQRKKVDAAAAGPLALAVSAHAAVPLPGDNDPEALSALWLGRVCRTASHELGHCFGLEHCVYYACVMQGSASLREDARQPPYLCPVDLAKVLAASGADIRARYKALLDFGERHKGVGLFDAFAAWIEARLRELD